MVEAHAPGNRRGSPLELRLIDLGPCDPYTAQTFCESVAVSVGAGESPDTLLLATPRTPYVSLGFHQSQDEELDPRFLTRRGVPVIRRATGGGATWLDRSQAFYEVVVRETETLSPGATAFQRFLGPPVAYLRSLGLRSARLREPSDIVVGRQKVSGNAGGTWGGALIIQGGLLGMADIPSMSGMLRSPHPAFRRLLAREMGRWITSVAAETGRAVPAGVLRRGLIEAYRSTPGFRLRRGSPTRDERRRYRAEVLPRHRDPDWTRGLAGGARPAGLLREVRVAGGRHVQAWRFGSATEVLLVVTDGGRVEEVFETRPFSAGRSWESMVRSLPPGDERLRRIQVPANGAAPTRG